MTQERKIIEELVAGLNRAQNLMQDGGISRENFQPIQELADKGQKFLSQPEQRDFTPEEALEEARKRWGDAAHVSVGLLHSNLEYAVGHWDEENVHYYEQGSGISFREAFVAADKEPK